MDERGKYTVDPFNLPNLENQMPSLVLPVSGVYKTCTKNVLVLILSQ